jgi:hypothetical protein
MLVPDVLLSWDICAWLCQDFRIAFCADLLHAQTFMDKVGALSTLPCRMHETQMGIRRPRAEFCVS